MSKGALVPWTRSDIARRAATELLPGEYVNLGIGLPTLVADHLPADSGVVLHSENGILGVGPYPTADEVDADIINAGKETVTLAKQAATFDSSLSFAMVRGGHIDVALLGGMEVSAAGDLANWAVPGATLRGFGGAMDLVHGAGRLIILMTHRTNTGEPKLVRTCALPLTGPAVVDMVITDLGVFEPLGKAFALVELAPEVTVDQVAAATAADVVDATSSTTPQPHGTTIPVEGTPQ